MSEVKVNKISPRSGTAITLGDSGDTFTIPSGATLAIAGSVTGFTSAGIDDNATSVAITIDSSERVGIGNTSPAFQLDINSGTNDDVLRLESTDNTVNFDIKDSTSNTRLAHSQGSFSINVDRDNQVASSNLAFKIDNTEKARLNSTGLGIGTSSPATTLHIAGSIPKFRIQDTDTTSQAFDIRGANADVHFDLDPNNAVSGGDIKFDIDGSNKMMIRSSGTVGIGVAPSTASASGATIKGLVIGDNNATGVFTGLQILNRVENSTTSNGIAIDFDHKVSGSTTIPLARVIAKPSSSTSGNLQFYTSTSSSLAERMRIDSSGNVGIGTTSPQSLLHVVGSSTTSQIIIENTDAGTAAAPDLFLYRNSSSPADGDSLGNIEFRGKNDNTEDTRYVINNAKIIDASDGTEDGQIEWQLLNAGSFQKILTMNPTEVVINEDSGDTDFRVESDASTHALFVQGSNGHIGMNTSSPTYALNIANGAGNMRIKTLDSANVANASTSLLEFHGTDNRAGYVGFVGGDMIIHTDTYSAGNIELETNGTERMRISGATGEVSIASSNVTQNAHLNVRQDTNGHAVTAYKSATVSSGALDSIKYIRAIPAVSAGTELIIPFISQNNINSKTYVHVRGISCESNTKDPKAFDCKFAVGHTSTLSNLTVLENLGKCTGASISGMNIVLAFSVDYTHSGDSGMFIELDYIAHHQDASINLSGIVMN